MTCVNQCQIPPFNLVWVSVDIVEDKQVVWFYKYNMIKMPTGSKQKSMVMVKMMMTMVMITGMMLMGIVTDDDDVCGGIENGNDVDGDDTSNCDDDIDIQEGLVLS